MYSQILVAIDGSKMASQALDAAIALALETHAQLQALYVIDVPVMAYDVPGFDPSIVRDAFVEEARLLCADAQARMDAAGLKGTASPAEVDLGAEDIAACIERVAAQSHADLIVMGTHGRHGVKRLVLGSVAERLLRNARRPVLLIPASALAPSRVGQHEVADAAGEMS